MNNLHNLHIHLQSIINQLHGPWISKNSGYEKEACLNLGFNCETKRYWDCEYDGSYIEIKKGKSIWLDEVRYCEIFMSDNIDNDECKKKTITMFLIPTKDKKKVEKIYIIDTQKLIDFMKIDKVWAERLLSRHKQTKRGVNCQQRMTIKDLRLIADYTIDMHE